jgi:hypothetical protein
MPHVKITTSYLRAALKILQAFHLGPQGHYHREKAKRLKAVHHNLDRFSETLFKLAILSVALYLLVKGVSVMGWINGSYVEKTSKLFTFLGVFFPTFGAAIAGIKFFGDFERFAAISEITAERLDAIEDRATLLLTAPDSALDYSRVSALVHATDDAVVAEIENWQSVFAGKFITVPV